MIVESHYPGTFIFGCGAIGTVRNALLRLGGKRPIVFADDGIRGSGLSDQLIEKLSLPSGLFSGFSGEPTLQLADSAARNIREGGYDSVIAIGGGSTLDLGKVAALLATNKGKISDYFTTKREHSSLPKILIPTTAGSGSETSSSAVIKCDDGIKRFVVGDDLVADVAIVDSNLTRSCPREVAAATGIDVLSTGLEAYLSKRATPFSDAYAVETIDLALRCLEKSVANADDAEALDGMSLAASLSGFASSTPADVNICHCIAETIGPMFDIAHGRAVATILPFMVQFNFEASQGRLRLLAHRLGLRDERILVLRITELVRALGFSTGFRQLGVPRDALEQTAKLIFDQRQYEYLLPEINPAPITFAGLLKLLEDCWNGVDIDILGEHVVQATDGKHARH
ncbi:MAG: iron-containing alcohol dehydrogenase [Verrucomicrobiota bacterium]